MRRGTWLVLAGSLVLAGCVRTNAVRLGVTPKRPPVPEREVALYRTAAQVPGRYEEVALINAVADATWTDEAQMMNAMRKTAGQLGANAVILDAISEPSAAAQVAATVLRVGVSRRGKSVAIYVLPDRGAAARSGRPTP